MSDRTDVRVGCRTSPLSLAQTEEILARLRPAHPGRRFLVVPVTTGGDRRKEAPLLSLGRGAFARDIETALLDGEIDFAVHSAKDVPSLLPEGLTLATFGERRDARDVIVSPSGEALAQMPGGSRLGTGSPRRAAQIAALRPDVRVVPVRGNVGTRVAKAKGPDYDGVVLAAAGLLRLGIEGEITEYLSPSVCTPDVGQGALAVEARSDDGEMLEMLAAVDHPPTTLAVIAERAFLARIGGGCQVPVAAYARLVRERLRLSTMAALPDGSRLFRIDLECDPAGPELAGRRAAERLMAAGAAGILARGAAL